MKHSACLRLGVVVTLVAWTNGTAGADVTVKGRTLDSKGSVIKIDQVFIFAEYADTLDYFGTPRPPDGAGGYTLPLNPPRKFHVCGHTVMGGKDYLASTVNPLPPDFDFTNNSVDLMFYTHDEYMNKFGKIRYKKHLENLLKILPDNHPSRKTLGQKLDEIR
jgi:hypothetical protein